MGADHLIVIDDAHTHTSLVCNLIEHSTRKVME